MPTYGYKCEKCQHEFEVVQSMSAAPLTVCLKESCGQKRWGHGRVTRQISGGAGLIFKGSGFYSTDYRSDKYKESAQKDHAPVTTPAAKSDQADAAAAPAKSPAAEAKPAPKTDKK